MRHVKSCQCIRERQEASASDESERFGGYFG